MSNRIYVNNINLVKKDSKRILNFIKFLAKSKFINECNFLSKNIKLNDILNTFSKSLGYNNYKELNSINSNKKYSNQEPQLINLYKKENWDLKVQFNDKLCNNLKSIIIKKDPQINEDFAFCVARSCVKQIYVLLDEKYRKNHSNQKLSFYNISYLSKDFGLSINALKKILVQENVLTHDDIITEQSYIDNKADVQPYTHYNDSNLYNIGYKIERSYIDGLMAEKGYKKQSQIEKMKKPKNIYNAVTNIENLSSELMNILNFGNNLSKDEKEIQDNLMFLSNESIDFFNSIGKSSQEERSKDLKDLYAYFIKPIKKAKEININKTQEIENALEAIFDWLDNYKGQYSGL